MDTEFDNFEDYLDEQDEINALRELFGDAFKKPKEYLALYNLAKYKQFALLYKSLCKNFENRNVYITYEIGEPDPSIGYISIIGKQINFSNMNESNELLNQLQKVDNIDTYILSDKSVRIDLTFYDLMRINIMESE